MPLAADFVSTLAKGMVESVTVRSQVTPDYTYDPWAPSPQPPPDSGSGWLMSLVKPTIYINPPGGGEPTVIAPYGEATENYVPHVVFGGIAAIIGTIMLIGWIARATKK